MYGFMICLVIIIIIGILIVRRNNKIIENEEKKIKEIEESSQNISIKFKAEGDSIEDEYTNWDENEDDEEDGVSKYSYFARKHMMTNAEERCFRILEETFSQKFYIFPQVHLSKILDHRVKGQNYYGAFQHINGKSVDFVLVRKTNMELICGVELDDYTHNYKSRQRRDTEVERMFRQAGFPLVRITEPQRISKREMIEIFRKKIVETEK